MNLYRIRYILYLVASVGIFSLLFIPLASDVTIDNPNISKTLLSIPFLLVILGKFISIMEKKRYHQGTLKDWSWNIGLIIATILYWFSRAKGAKRFFEFS